MGALHATAPSLMQPMSISVQRFSPPLVRRLCIVTGHLGQPGGAERVATWLANCWANEGVSVTVVTLGNTANSFFNLSPSVQIVPLGRESEEPNVIRSAAFWLETAWRLRGIFKASAPDCVISFVDVNNIISLIASRGLQTKIVISERADPHSGRRPPRWQRLIRWTYPWADRLVAQTQHALSFFPARIQAVGQVIPNPVVPSTSVRDSARSKGRKTVIGLGSLRRVKGFDRLIEAFGNLSAEYPDWDLVIYGEGPCRAELEEQIQKLRITDRVRLPGVTRESHARLCEADLFVLCSRSEGFPNALAEAMACGLAVISFDCISGPRELIRSGVDGILVPADDVAQLQKSMARVMGDTVLREGLAANAPEVTDRFSPDKVFAMWRRALEASLCPG